MDDTGAPKADPSSRELPSPLVWERLAAWEFADAVAAAQGVCVVPFGILESHGPHLPLGTDTIVAREVALRAAVREPFVVFPGNHFGFLATKHIPGNLCISYDVALRLLDEICAEVARNGFTRIVILNGHGGNVAGANFAVQKAFTAKNPYVVYSVQTGFLHRNAVRRLHEQPDHPGLTPEDRETLAGLATGRMPSGHAGIVETAMIAGVDEAMVHMDRAYDVDFSNQRRMDDVAAAGAYTWSQWHASYPNNYSADPAGGTASLGAAILDEMTVIFGETIAVLKADRALEVQQDYFDRWIEGSGDLAGWRTAVRQPPPAG